MLTKITKTQAIKALKNGSRVGAIASKMIPLACNGAFLCELSNDTQLDQCWVNRFRYYNCTQETGHGISFYLIEA